MKKPPQIDFTKIAFPSDDLTIRTLRRVYSLEFDSSGYGPKLDDFQSLVGTHLRDMFYIERQVAENAFNRTLGLEEAPILDRKGCLSNQADLYVRYGIARGRHHADELLRDIERQAIDQAHQHTRSRPSAGRPR